MRRHLVGLLWFSGTLIAATGDPLLLNGSVEDHAGKQPKAWMPTGGATGATFEWIEETGQPRNHVLSIAKTDPADQTPDNWFQTVKVPAALRGRRLELSARVRAQGMKLRSSACVMFQMVGPDEKNGAGGWTQKVESDTDWREVSTVFEVSGDCVSMVVRAYLVGAGTVFFDDLKLVETARPVSTPAPAGKRSKVEELARGCATDIGWRMDAEAAFEEARKERLPLLVYVRCIDQDDALAAAQSSVEAPTVRIQDDGYGKDLLMRGGPFCDADVAALIMRRFVPLILTYDLSMHGMGPSADDPLRKVGLSAVDVVTPAIAILDATGEVVHVLHRIGTLNAPTIDRVLREGLAQAKGRKPEDEDPASLFFDGELEEVIRKTAAAQDEASRVLAARALQRLGRLDDAGKILEKLHGEESALQRGRLWLARGDSNKALDELEHCKLPADHPRREELVFWKAWCKRFLGRHGEADSEWESMAGPTPMGRKAALAILQSGVELALAETPVVFPSNVELPKDTETHDATAPFDPVRSITVLLELQRADGSYGSHEGVRGMGFSDAGISGIVGEAFLRWRATVPAELRKRMDAALERIDVYLERWSNDHTPAGTDGFNHPYALMYLLRRKDEKAVEKLIDAIARTQNPDGNWTVYQVERPASFNTALNVMALARAKAAAFEVPKETLASGVKALESMRTEQGLFPYSTLRGHEWMTTEHGSIGRDALCEQALLEAGRKTSANIAKALERFVKHHEELRAPTKKLYDYFNSRGHGGYYFFFAHFHAHEAAMTLPEARRKRVLVAIRAEVLRAKEFDGTWIDKTLLGRAYGTAMALCILADS